MPYSITLSDGSLLTTIADDTLDNTTALTLLGRNYIGYGSIVAENFVYLLENFSNTTPPSSPLTGQLWYNTEIGTLEVWNGAAWTSIGAEASSLTIAETTADNTGLLFFDTLSPSDAKYYRFRARDDGLYAGHFVLESLNDDLSLKTVILNTDNVGDLVIAGTVTPNSPTGGWSSANVGHQLLITTPTSGVSPGIAFTDSTGINLWGIYNTTGTLSIASMPAYSNSSSAPVLVLQLSSTGARGITQALTDNSTYLATTAFVYGNTRIRLIGNLNLYVSSTGSDSNNGLTTGTAFATLQGAWNAVMASYDLAGFAVTINVAAGTYAGVTCVRQAVGESAGVTNTPQGTTIPAIIFLGQPLTPANVIINAVNANCFAAEAGANISVSGFTLNASGTSLDYRQLGVGLYTFNSGAILFNNVNFGTCTGGHMVSTTSGMIDMPGTGTRTYSILGNAPSHLLAFDKGFIAASVVNPIVVGTVAFSGAFCIANSLGMVAAYSNVFSPAAASGNVTGARYSVSGNAIIQTLSAGENYFPGTPGTPGNGSISTGGIYA